MNYISHIETIVPEFAYKTEEIIDVLIKPEATAEELDLMQRLFLRSGIKQRNFCLPLEQIKKISGNEERAEHFQKLGLKLCTELLNKLSTKVDLKTITHLVSTSCTVPIVPALDAEIIPQVGLSPNIRRIPIFQHGCVAGTIGLSICNDLAANGKILLLSSELCSLLFPKTENDPEVVLGNSLFADGAACVVISPEKSKFKIISTKSVLIPETACFLGYEIKDHLTKVLLKKEIVATLNQYAPTAIKSFLEEKGLRPKDIAWWLIHPGGYKIITAIEESLEIPPEKSKYSWQVLSKYGNVSSAAILFVLKELEQDKQYRRGDKILLVGMGPGMSVEIVLLECAE